MAVGWRVSGDGGLVDVATNLILDFTHVRDPWLDPGGMTCSPLARSLAHSLTTHSPSDCGPPCST